jgi:GPI mannosyltransferase 2
VDHDANVFNPPELSLDDNSLLNILFGGLRRWDAIHFIHISNYGYIYEHSAAFFPFFPLIVHFTTIAIGLEIKTSNLLMVALGINFVVFNLAALVLFKLTKKVFGNDKQDYCFYCVLFFCLNPANIFFTAPYSESLYTLLTFTGLFYLFDDNSSSSSLIRSVFFFSLSTLTRSNGSINFGFILFFQVKSYLIKTKSRLDNFKSFLSLIINLLSSFNGLILLIKLVISFICIISSFVLYQLYIYSQFCYSNQNEIPVELVNYGKEEDYRLTSEGSSEWCNKTLPFSYTFVQGKYWQVGFMSYWKLKQIPNFALAFPILITSARAIYIYLRVITKSENQLLKKCFGFVKEKDEKVQNNDQQHWELNELIFPFSIHLIFLLISSLFFMHVQVSFDKK